MPKLEHTPEQGQRVHWLANLGGLVVIAGLEQYEPELLVGALVSIAAQLARGNAERDERIRTLGAKTLKARGAEKRAFAAYQRARNLHAVYLTSEQCRRLLDVLGCEEVPAEALISTLMTQVRSL